MIKNMLIDLFMNYSRQKKYSMIRKLITNSHSFILDIACGRGEFLEKYVYEDYKNLDKLNNIIALDVRERHLIDLKKKYTSCKLVVADACNLPFKDKSIDLVVSNAFLEHIPLESRAEFASEVRRVGRSYWISTPNRFSLFEVHYYLPFIGWIGAELRNKVIGFISRNKLHYDPIYLLKAGELKKLFRDYTGFQKLNFIGLFSHLIIFKNNK